MDGEQVADGQARRKSPPAGGEEARRSASPKNSPSPSAASVVDAYTASRIPEGSQSPEYTKRARSDDVYTAITATTAGAAPLNYDDEPPLPPGHDLPPGEDGWDAKWSDPDNCWYFINYFTGVWQWENPRVPGGNVAGPGPGPYDSYATYGAPGTSSTYGAPGTGAVNSSGAPGTTAPPKRVAGGYNPAIHGNYDPNADYAIEARKQEEEEEALAASQAAIAAGMPDPNQTFTAEGHFNRFTGRFQAAGINPDNHSDEAKSRRQMNAFFDVDAAANSHDGRSLKAERRNKTLSRKEVEAFKDKRRQKKEDRRRAWLRD